MWVMGLVVSVRTILGAVNMVTTVAPCGRRA